MAEYSELSTGWAGVGAIDTVPTEGSTKLITSGGVYAAIQAALNPEVVSFNNILQSANTTRWLLGVTNAGALTTTETATTGTGSLILTSPDASNWLIGVSDAGVLNTTETGTAGITSIVLTSPDATQYVLTVNNAGALVTTEI